MNLLALPASDSRTSFEHDKDLHLPCCCPMPSFTFTSTASSGLFTSSPPRSSAISFLRYHSNFANSPTHAKALAKHPKTTRLLKHRLRQKWRQRNSCSWLKRSAGIPQASEWYHTSNSIQTLLVTSIFEAPNICSIFSSTRAQGALLTCSCKHRRSLNRLHSAEHC